MSPDAVIKQSFELASALGLESTAQSEMTARVLRHVFPGWSESQVQWTVNNAQSAPSDSRTSTSARAKQPLERRRPAAFSRKAKTVGLTRAESAVSGHSA